MADYPRIALKDIKPDPKQPRKFYDEHELAELAMSITKHGVIQPITIRPNGKSYLLVCGERRYKASLLAKLKDIPVVIKEMTDEEALEIQIVENLQRKDVHPLEEAAAFQTLFQTKQIEEIALKVGKSASFVAKRLKLMDLVPDAQDIYFAGHLSHTDALLMAKLDQDLQKEIIKVEAPKNWKKEIGGSWEIDNISYYSNQNSINLSKAVFKIGDAKLYPEAGACTKCPHNTGNQPLLFDEEKKSLCTRPTCFQIKVNRAKRIKFEKLVADPDKVFIVQDHWLSDSDRKDVALAKEIGIQVLDRSHYDLYNETEDELLSFEEWFDDEQMFYDAEDLTNESKKKDIEADYNRYKENWEEERKKVQSELSAGIIVKGYVIAGNGAGKETMIRLKRKAAIGESIGSHPLSLEIANIEKRQERNIELDYEKMWTAIRGLVDDDKENNLAKLLPTSELTSIEIKALCIALKERMSYPYDDFLEQIFGEFDEIETFTIPMLNCIARAFMYHTLISSYGSHAKENSRNALAYAVMKQYLHPEIEAIEREQQEKTDARAGRVAKRIAALERKMAKAAQPSE